MKKKIVLVVPLLICAAALTYIMSNYKYDSVKANTISSNEVQMLMENSEDAFILVGSRTCSSCQKFTPIVDKVVNDTGTEVFYLDSANSNNKSFLSENNIQVTPTIIILKNGELTRVEGVFDYSETKTIFEKGEV